MTREAVAKAMTERVDQLARTRTGAGLPLALLSAAAFGTSGPMAAALIGTGWTPLAAVAARVLGAALALTVPTVVTMRGRWHLLGRHARSVLAYGAFGVAACQLCYFTAVTHLSVGVALLVEYLAPVLLVGWLWLRTGTSPATMTLVGSGAALVGLLLVLDVAGGAKVDLPGVLWAFGAAIGAVVYFVTASRDDTGLPSIALAGTGMGVGGILLVAAGAVGLLPLRTSTAQVQLAGHASPWWVPIVIIAVVAAALAYVTGTAAARLLGPTLASFAAMTEVLFAVLFAWLLLGQLPTPVQLAGGAFILLGVGVVRYAQLRSRPTRRATPDLSVPTVPADERG